MKNITILFLALILYACNPSSDNKSNKLNQDLATVTDSIAQLMAQYHYNPEELASNEYLDLEKKIQNLANTVETKDEFINGFNGFWKDGPFSHVLLGVLETPAEKMAEFIDSLRVGDHSVSLEWEEQTAILTVTTMTGVDTKEGVFEAYQEIEKNNTKSLIIDLRNNTGGTFAGVPLIGHVLTDPIDAGIFVSRKWWKNNKKAPSIDDVQELESWHGWSIKSFWQDVQEQPLTRVQFKPMSPHFNGPVYVLTSNKTASAAEFAVDALAQMDNVTIIGETTAGEMLSQKMFDLPHGVQLSLPIAEYYSARIGRIEGKGVQPDITIDQSIALELATSLINGEDLNEAIANLQQELDKKDEEPLGGETIYLFGNMNDWGKKWSTTPRFEYKGKGIYETTTTMKKGKYEFKVAPMDWDFDYGATKAQETVLLGQKTALARVAGSDNLIINIEEEVALTFSLDVSDVMSAALLITK